MKRVVKIVKGIIKQLINFLKETIKYMIQDKYKTKKPAIVITILTGIPILLLYNFYSSRMHKYPWADVVYHFLEIWSDKGLELVAFYVSLVLLIPNLSFKSKKTKKEFVASKNSKIAVWLTCYYCMLTIFASQLQPCAFDLFLSLLNPSTSSEFLRRLFFCIFVVIAIIFIFSLAVFTYFFITIISEFISYYKKDLAHQKNRIIVKKRETKTFLRVCDNNNYHTRIKTIQSISTMRKVQDTPSQEEN